MTKWLYPKYTLADVVDALEKDDYGLTRRCTLEQLQDLTKVSPQFNEPTHIAVKLKKRANTTEMIYAVYANLGQVYFSDNDCLESFQLDHPHCFFNIQVKEGQEWTSYEQDEVGFKPAGSTKWQAVYDFEYIFHHYGLDGSDDYAPFMAFYSL